MGTATHRRAAASRRLADPLRNSEAAIRDAIAEMITDRLAPGVHGIGFRDAGVGPDFLFIIEGRTHCLKIKNERGQLSAAQHRDRESLIAAGATWAMAKGFDQAAEQLRIWRAIPG